MEKLARLFFVLTLVFAGAFIAFFLLFAQKNNELNESKVQRANLQQQVSTLQNQLNRRDVEYEEVQRKLEEAQSNLEGMSDENLADLREQLNEKESSLEAKDEKIAELNERINQLETDSGTGTVTAETNQEELIKLKKEYENEIEKYQKQVSAQQEEIERLNEILASQDSEDQRIQDLRERVASLQQSLDEAISHSTELEDKLESKNNEMAELRDQLARADNSVEVINEKQTEIDKKDQEIQSLKDRLEEKNNEMAKKDEKISQLEDQLNERLSEVENLKAKLDREKKYDSIPEGEADAVKYKYLLLGEDALSSGKVIESASYFQKAKLDNLSLGDLHQVYDRKRTLAYQKAIAQYYNQGYSDYKEEQFEQSLQQLNEAMILSNEVSTSYSDDILYYKALSEYNLNDYNAAENDFTRLISREEDSNYVPHSLYYLTKIYQKRGMNESLLDALDSLEQYSRYETYAKNLRETIQQ